MGGGADEKGLGSLESSKPTSFAFTLRTAIKTEFATGKNFANKLEVTEGRVSQILSGEIVSPYTLDLILRCFESFSNRKVIYDAWLSTFAPSPVLSGGSSDDHISRLITEANSLKAAGKASALISALEAALSETSNTLLRFMILEEAANTSLYLGRTSNALQVIETLQLEATTLGERGWIAKSLYLKANASRTMRPTNPKLIVKCHEDAISYAKSFSNESAMCRLLVDSLERDRALTVAILAQGKHVDENLFTATVSAVNEGITRTDDLAGRLLWLEAKVRLLLSRNELFGAEETLEHITGLKAIEPADFNAKEQISRATLLMARGQLEEAESILMKALDESLSIDNLHHSGRIDRLLSKILAARMLT